MLCYCLPSGFSYIHVQILACFPVQFTNIKKYVQMATVIICDVMIFSLNYSTCTTPISVLPLPNLYRMLQFKFLALKSYEENPFLHSLRLTSDGHTEDHSWVNVPSNDGGSALDDLTRKLAARGRKLEVGIWVLGG